MKFRYYKVIRAMLDTRKMTNKNLFSLSRSKFDVTSHLRKVNEEYEVGMQPDITMRGDLTNSKAAKREMGRGHLSTYLPS